MIWPTAMDSEGRTPVQFFGEQLSRPEPGLFVYAPGVALGDIDGSSKYRSSVQRRERRERHRGRDRLASLRINSSGWPTTTFAPIEARA
jgi:hypothetical protein